MDIPVLQDIIVILGLSVLVLLLFQKIRIPTMVGFLLTGAIAGPSGLSLTTGHHHVEMLAEVGVIFLLFLIGMEFSLKNLIAAKRMVLLGGSVQVIFTITAFSCIAYALGLDLNKSVFIGFLFSLSSTAIVLKLLQEKGEVNSPHGKFSLAILIFQDIVVVPMMLFTPMLTGSTGSVAKSLLLLSAKGLAMIVFVFICARFIVPKLLYQIARTKSKELFIISIVAICFSIAWLSSSLGLSLALGAFLAGLIISESEYHHEATALVIPFRELFTSFFFISVGMLMELSFLFEHFPTILLLTFLTFLLKGALASAAAWMLRFPLRPVILVGLCLFQVGEFSFILSRVGLDYHLLSPEYYQYFLSISILTMIATPFIIKSSNNIYYYFFGRILPIDRTETLREVSQEKRSGEFNDHLVIIGYGINGKNVAKAAKHGNIPYAIIELNPETVMQERARGEPIIYGDAVKPNILQTVNIQKARVAVIAISDPDATKRILSNILHISTQVHTIIRTRLVQEMEEYYKMGADEVIPEEFETSIEIFTRVLHKYLVPQNQVESFIQHIRADNYEMFRPLSDARMSSIGIDLPNVDIASLTVQQDKNDIVGKKIIESEVRRKYGITIVSIKRDSNYIYDIQADTMILQNDVLYVFGDPDKIYEFNQKIKI